MKRNCVRVTDREEERGAKPQANGQEPDRQQCRMAEHDLEIEKVKLQIHKLKRMQCGSKSETLD